MKNYLARIVALMTVIVFNGCDSREIKQYSIDQFMNTTSIFGSSFSHDDKLILFSSNATGVYNGYTIPVGGGESTPITHSEENTIYTISFFPKDNRILYRSDDGGNEIYHIYLKDENGGVTDLTPDSGSRSIFYEWSHDRKSFYYGSNKRNPKFMDVYEMDINSFEPRMVFENDQGLSIGAISNDKKYIAFIKIITRANTDMYLYNTDNEEMKHLTPHEGEIYFSPQSFSYDSKKLYYLSDEDSEFKYVKSYDLVSGDFQLIESLDWDVTYTYFSYEGRYNVTASNNDARTEIKIVDGINKEQVALPELPLGEITSVNISRSEKLMTFYHNGSKSSSNLYVFDFEKAEYKKLTNTMSPDIYTEDLVEAKVIRYKSFDDLVIPAILYKPKNIESGAKAPAVLWIHGGPGGQSRLTYKPLLQYLANHGYVVLSVNNRGSSGYGKTFYGLDNLRHGEDDLLDCVAAKSFLASTGYVDVEKIGIMGGSYGGYMVLAALTLQPEEFAVGVDLYGISNWVRTLESIPEWWESFRESLYKELGNPKTDKERLQRISPLFHAENIVKPLFVLQGANDPRVLKVESDEIVEAARSNGVPVEYLVFDDEGHGLRKKKNQLKAFAAILDFLDIHLRGDTK